MTTGRDLTRTIISWTSYATEDGIRNRDRELYLAKPLLRPLTPPWRIALQSIFAMAPRR